MTKQQSMMKKLLEFYSIPQNIELFRRITKDGKKTNSKIKKSPKTNENDKNDKNDKNEKKKPKISLRLIYWFCTNYAKQYGTKYYITKKQKKVLFHAFIEYSNELSSETKDYFDVFCRAGDNNENLISLEIKENDVIKTTTAQLNFFRWAITNDIIPYIESNIVKIYEDMQNRGSNSKNKKIDPNGKVIKRQISDNNFKNLNQYELVNVSLKMSVKKQPTTQKQ